MKINISFCFCAFVVLFCVSVLNAADDSRKAADKGVGASIADDAKEVKKEFKKTVGETKEAVVHDVKALKEEVPKGLKEAKKEIIKTSKEAKEGAKQELREIREGLNAPRTPVK